MGLDKVEVVSLLLDVEAHRDDAVACPRFRIHWFGSLVQFCECLVAVSEMLCTSWLLVKLCECNTPAPQGNTHAPKYVSYLQGGGAWHPPCEDRIGTGPPLFSPEAGPSRYSPHTPDPPRKLKRCSRCHDAGGSHYPTPYTLPQHPYA